MLTTLIDGESFLFSTNLMERKKEEGKKKYSFKSEDESDYD